AASYDYYYRTGEIPPRTGNRQSGLNSAPYNVFPTADGHVAIHVVTEAHFQNLLKAMGREDLADDPRFATNAGRVAHMDETDALVDAWTRTLPKMEVFARAKAYRIPCAPVRNAPEVMNDPHMHERGMLERIDHPELGPHVSEKITGAIHFLGSPSSSDPGMLTKAYADLFLRKGGRFLIGDARALTAEAFGWSLRSESGPITAREAVVALGPWSDDVFRPLGYDIPLAVKR